MIVALALLAFLNRVEIVSIDLRTGAVDAATWTEAGPVGSLIKPFTALAYASSHEYRYPQFVCTGKNCWLPAGHGRIGIREAVGHSCNAYFRHLAAATNAEAMTAVFKKFGLEPPPATSRRRTYIGIGDNWRVKPADLLQAYRELLARRAEPGVEEILDGMALSARSGTGKAVGSGLMVKTGTAPCVHRPHAPGDGLAFSPAQRPERAILIRVHSTTGATAARELARVMKDTNALDRH